eukprot:3433531-Amphidinium_carterae.1
MKCSFQRFLSLEESRTVSGGLWLPACVAHEVLCLATILREERATHGVSLKTHKLFFFVYSA